MKAWETQIQVQTGKFNAKPPRGVLGDNFGLAVKSVVCDQSAPEFASFG